jgi:hypothetical protein
LRFRLGLSRRWVLRAELLNHLVEVAFKRGIIQGIPVTLGFYHMEKNYPVAMQNTQ